MPTSYFTSAQRKISPLLLTIALLLSATSQAQFLSAPQVLRESRFEYNLLAPATSTPAFLTQANAEGSTRFSFVGDNAFGDPLNPAISAIYVRASALPATYLYQTVPAASSVAAFISQLNTQGALGYRYFGDQIYAGTVASVLVKESSSATYQYRGLTPASSASTFLALVNSEGAQGYQYQGDVGIDSGGGNFVFASVFSRNSATPSTYSYETATITASAAALVVQANSQGARNFLYRGGIAFSGSFSETLSLYEKDNTRGDTFRYEQLARSATAPAFLSQTNAQGARRFRYFGEVGFADGTFASFYASVAPIFTNGFDD